MSRILVKTSNYYCFDCNADHGMFQEGDMSKTIYHVLRGGGWSTNDYGCRLTIRHTGPLVNGDYGTGFRLVFRSKV